MATSLSKGRWVNEFIRHFRKAPVCINILAQSYFLSGLSVKVAFGQATRNDICKSLIICIYSFDRHRYGYVVECRSVRLSVPNDGVTTLTLEGFQILAWILVVWCTVPWSRSLYKWSCSANFCAFHSTLKLSMTGSDQIRAKRPPLLLFKDFRYQPEIWWCDAEYHEAGRYLIWPWSAIFARSMELWNFPW